MRDLSRAERCRLFAAEHRLDNDLPEQPLSVADYFGEATAPRAGASVSAQAQPPAAPNNQVRRDASRFSRPVEPDFSPVRFDDTGFADDCLI
jgi:hypothetical protein